MDANDNCGDWTSEFKALVHCCLALPADAGRMAKLSAPRRRDFPVVKLRHFAFYAAPLELLPEHLHRKRLIVTGLSVLKFDKADDARPQDKDEWPAGA